VGVGPVALVSEDSGPTLWNGFIDRSGIGEHDLKAVVLQPILVRNTHPAIEHDDRAEILAGEALQVRKRRWRMARTGSRTDKVLRKETLRSGHCSGGSFNIYWEPPQVAEPIRRARREVPRRLPSEGWRGRRSGHRGTVPQLRRFFPPRWHRRR